MLKISLNIEGTSIYILVGSMIYLEWTKSILNYYFCISDIVYK
jgi:hypothetical protein